MIKTVLALSLSALVAGCTFKGFRLPPDASLSWELCNAKKIVSYCFYASRRSVL